MHITSQTPTELVVEDSSLWISYLCAGAGFVVVVGAIAQNKPGGFLVAALFLLFATVFEAKTTFTFDATQRLVHWTGFRWFKRHAGTIPFDEIRYVNTDVNMASTSSGNSVPCYRLTLVTTNGDVPMAYMYRGRSDRYAPLRQQIMDFMKPGSCSPEPEPEILSNGVPADLESSIRSLLAQGRKIDAVALLRTREKIGLADAVTRIDAFAASGQQEN